MTMELSACRCPECEIGDPHCSFACASKLSTSSRWILIKAKYYSLWNSHFHCDFNSVHTLGLRIQGRGCSSFIFIKITGFIFMLLFRLPEVYINFYLDFFFSTNPAGKKIVFLAFWLSFLQNIDTGKNISHILPRLIVIAIVWQSTRLPLMKKGSCKKRRKTSGLPSHFAALL